MSCDYVDSRLRPSLIQLLNNTFPRVTFDPESLRRGCHRLPLKTPLFSIRERFGDYILKHDEESYPPIYCMRFIKSFRNGCQDFNGDTNTIPVRWFHILKEVYLPRFEFEVTPMDYTEQVNAIPDMALRTIVEDARRSSRNCCASLSITDPDWWTGNACISELTRDFFKACKDAKFKCLDGHYTKLAAAEGGIQYRNSYVRDFVELNHCFMNSSIRNETKGEWHYHLSKDILFEELVVLSILLTKHGIENTLQV